MSEDNSDASSKLVVTRDGSHTVYSSKFDQHYHNPNGAVAESRYVFFEQTGLLNQLKSSSEITIFEVGFGTGLNLMLLLDYCLKLDTDVQLNYYSVEGFPLSADTAANLNYRDHLEHPEVIPEVTAIFKNLKKGMNTLTVLDRVSVKLFYGLFEELPDLPVEAEFIFHDAFSPEVNPDLWTGEVFKKIARLSSKDVILSTYCAASKAKGALAWAGWKLARARGALGKREMTLAALDESRLGDRTRINEERLAHRYETGDF